MATFDRLTITGNSDRGHLNLVPLDSAPAGANSGGIYVGSDHQLYLHTGSGWSNAASAQVKSQSRGNKTIGFGDSITYGNTNETAGLNLGNLSYFNWATVLSDSRIRFVRNAGIGGNTVADMLARVDDDVIAYAPDRCLILGGTNDLAGIDAGTKTVAGVLADYEAILDALQAAGIEPIIVTLPPRSSYQDELEQFNVALYDLAASRGHVIVDGYSSLVDPTTRAMQASYTSDGIHPTQAGAKVLGQSVATQLATHYAPIAPYLTKSATDSINLLANGTMTTDATANGQADSFSFSGSGGTVTFALVDDAAVVGKMQEIAIAAASSRVMSQVMSTDRWDPGDRLAFSGVVEAESFAGGMTLSFGITFTGGGANRLYVMQGVTQDFGPSVFYAEITIPAAATVAYMELQSGASGTGTIRLGQATVLNLTQLGFA